MIAESTRPATVDDLEILDDRRYRVLWAGGTPWGCMLWAPVGVTGLVAMLAVPFALLSHDWRVVGVAAGVAAGASFFVALSVAGLELARLRWAGLGRAARAAAMPPLRVLRATASRAWLVADTAAREWAPFVVFDAGDGELLCVDAGTAFRLAGAAPRSVPEAIPGGVELVLEPGSGWPLRVALSGAEVPLVDLMEAVPPVVLLPVLEGRPFPVRVGLDQVSPGMRDVVEGA